jgi:hypothetical protein
MAIRFSKRIKIAPGVNLNLSKSGISTTLGPKNASVNVGKKGAHLNASIPGTGLGVREKIIGAPPKPTRTKQAKKAEGGSVVLGTVVIVILMVVGALAIF